MRDTLKALTDAATDAIGRAIAEVKREANRAEQLRAAEHRAFMAEQRETLAQLSRKIEDRLAGVRDGRDGEDGKPGADGKDGRDGINGKDADPATIDTAVARAVAAAIAELPIPKDGRDGIDGKDGRDGSDGTSVDPAVIEAAVADAVSVAIAALPVPKDGRDGVDGQNGRDGADGLGIRETLLDEAGGLIVTMTDGSVRQLGRIVGPAGAPGRDGADGQGLSDVQVTQDGANITLAFNVGEVRSSFDITLPAGPAGRDGKDAYAGQARGLFDPEATYRAMDVVSLNGSEFRAKRDDPGQCPGDGWALSASRGKRGDRGERGPDGREGKAGRSIVAAYADPKAMEIVLTDDAGTEHKIDLYEIARAIRAE